MKDGVGFIVMLINPVLSGRYPSFVPSMSFIGGDAVNAPQSAGLGVARAPLGLIYFRLSSCVAIYEMSVSAGVKVMYDHWFAAVATPDTVL